MRQDTLEAFELFIEKTEKLKSFEFVNNPKRTSFNWSWNDGNEKVEITGQSAEVIDAFLLTYRFFFDQKEHCSFRWLTRNVFNDFDLSEDWINEFCKLRCNLNQFLDSYPSIRIKNNGYPSPMTNRGVWELILFGNLSHATWDMDRHRKYNKLMSHNATKGLLMSQFVDILFITFDIVIKVSDLCKSEIENNV